MSLILSYPGSTSVHSTLYILIAITKVGVDFLPLKRAFRHPEIDNLRVLGILEGNYGRRLQDF